MIKFLLTVAALVMASAAPANAGPVFLAVMAAGGSFGAAFGATAFGSFLTTTMLGRLLTSVALGALKQVLAPKAKSGQSSGIQTNITQTGADQPVSWVMGKYATAGVMACPPMTHGKFGKTPNAYLTYVINLSDIPGMTLNRVAINGVWVTFSGAADPDYGTPATGDHASYAWLKYYNGSQVAADPMLLSKYGSYPDRPWLSDMIGRDTCYAILTFRVRQQLYSGFPTVLFEVSGIPLYDPRKDTTVGGSGAHRWANRATWEPSNNPFVQTYNIMRGIQITSTEYWGGRAEASDVPLSTWFTAMNACDASVDLLGGGTEPTYRSGIEVFGNDEPASVIEELLKAAAGDVCDIGGVWKARAGSVSLPVYMFTDDDVIITQSGTFDPFPAGLSGVYNAAVATYPEPISTYETETSPQMLFADYEAQDRGQRLPASLSLPSVPYTYQVQRLCDGYVRDNRKFRRHSVPMPPAAMILEPLDATAWTSDRNGYIGKVFEVEEIRDDIMSGLQGVSMRERDPNDYSWVPGRTLPSEPIGYDLLIPAAQDVPEWTVTGVSILDSSSNARRPALRLTWNGTDQDDIAGIEWQIRLTGTVNATLRGSTTLLDNGVFNHTDGILPNMAYEARGRFLSGLDRNWTAWTAATTPNTGFTDADFGTAGAYETLFTDFGLYAIRDVTSLPASGAFVGEKVFNRADGKLYQWTGTAWQLMVADVAAGMVTTASFAAGITPVEILAALPTTGNFEGRLVYLTTDNKLYRHTGSPTGSAGFTRVTDGADITPATLTAAAFASTIAPVEILATLPTTGNYAGRTVFLTTDSKMYRHTGSPSGSAGFTTAVPAVDITGQIITAQIADAALTTAKFASGITPVEIVAALPTTGNFAGRTVFLTSDSKTYRHTGSPSGSAGFTAAVPAVDVTGQIVATQITDGILTAAKFASTIAPVEIFATLPTTGNYAGRTVFLTSDSKLYRHTGSPSGSAGYTVAVDGADIVAGSIVAGKIAAGAIGATEIAAGAILASKIVVSDFANIYPDFDMLDAGFYSTSTAATYSFTMSGSSNLGQRFLNIGVSAAAESVESQWFPVEPSTEYRVLAAAFMSASTAGTGTVTVTFETGTLDNAGVVGGLTSDVVRTATDTTGQASTAITVVTGSTARRGRFVITRAAGGTGGGRAAAFKVQKKSTGALIVDGTITTVNIAANTITAGNIAAGTITATEIAADTITAGQIAAGAISTTELAALAVTAGKIAANTITAGQIAALTITATEIAGATITGTKIAAGTITASNIAADTITAGVIAAGAIGASEIAAGAILASKIVVSDFANIYPDFDMLDADFYTTPNGAVMTFNNNGVSTLGKKYLNVDANAALRTVDSGWFTIEPSTEYLVSAAAFMSSAAGGSGTVTVTFQTGTVDNTGVIATLTNTTVNTRTDSTTNTPVAVTVVSDATARVGRFITSRAAGGAAAGRSGGFKLQKKGTGSLTVDGTITGTKIAAGTITAANIAADTITAGVIAAGAIGASEIAAGAIVAGKIAAGAIVAADIAAGTITGDRIVANTITGGLLATSGIITNTAQINNLMVTGAKIANLAVDTLQIAGNAVTIVSRFVENVIRNITSTVTWVEIGRLIITRTAGCKTDFQVSVTLDGYGNGLMDIGIFRGTGTTVPILSSVGSTVGGRQSVCSFSCVDPDIAAGSTTYVLKARKTATANTGGWDANTRSLRVYMAAQQFKK